jgi:hypothetical protein
VKKLLGILAAVVLVLVPASVFASDPTNVDVVVVSGGGVEVNLDVTAGVSTVTIDGVPLYSTIQGLGGDITGVALELRALQAAYSKSLGTVQDTIKYLQQVTDLLTQAEAKLITNQSSMGQTYDYNFSVTDRNIKSLQGQIAALLQTADKLKEEIDDNLALSASVVDLQKLADELNALELNTFMADVKANYQTLTDAVNVLNQQATESQEKTETATRIAVLAVIVALAVFVFSAVVLSKRILKG